MANIFTRSTDGVDTDDGSTWALAKATLTGAAAIDVAGDIIHVSQAHSEATAAGVTLPFAGTPAAPVSVLCVDDSAGTPGTLAETAVVATNGSSFTLTINGSLYAHGITWQCGTSGSSISLAAGGGATVQTYKRCVFDLRGTNNGVRISAGNQNAPVKMTWEETAVRFAAAGAGITIGSDFHWRGGEVASGGIAPTSLFFGGGGRQCDAMIEGVDFSNLGTAFNFVGVTTSAGKIIIRNCKLPASWSGALVLTPPPGLRVEMHNCDSIDTNYQLWVEDYAGSIKTQTLTLVRSGGATDGATPYSWKMATSANAAANGIALESPELARWNSTVGAPVTVTVDVLHDSATALTDGEIWLDVQYLGTSGVPLSLFASDAKAGPLAAAVAQAASSATWDSTGMAIPNRQKLSVTFTPQEAGYLHAKVVLAKPNVTVYVDPKLQVT